MKELKELISKEPTENHSEWFKSIANHLMKNYVIETKSGKYRLLEIEFYYHSLQHPDETTYGYAKDTEALKEKKKHLYRNKMAQRKNLTWFIHYSGIDIVIGNNENPGGILIRSLQNVNDKEILKGPLIVLLELMNQGTSIDGDTSFQLSLINTDVQFGTDEKIEQQKRIGISNGNHASEKYNFFITPLIKPTPAAPAQQSKT